MPFTLTDETTVDVLIFWMESSDGSISYDEDEAIKAAIEKMDYSMRTYRDTLSRLGALSNEHLQEVIENAKTYAKQKYTDAQKRNVVQLLDAISKSDDNDSEEQQKLARFKEELGV